MLQYHYDLAISSVRVLLDLALPLYLSGGLVIGAEFPGECTRLAFDMAVAKVTPWVLVGRDAYVWKRCRMIR